MMEDVVVVSNSRLYPAMSNKSIVPDGRCRFDPGSGRDNFGDVAVIEAD